MEKTKEQKLRTQILGHVDQEAFFDTFAEDVKFYCDVPNLGAIDLIITTEEVEDKTMLTRTECEQELDTLLYQRFVRTNIPTVFNHVNVFDENTVKVSLRSTRMGGIWRSLDAEADPILEGGDDGVVGRVAEPLIHIVGQAITL